MEEEGATEVLNALVPLLSIRPVLDDFCRLGGSWESPHSPPGNGWALFHIVLHGSCVVERPGVDTLILEAGDILLLPHGDGHFVRSVTPGARRPVSTQYRNGIRQRTTSQYQNETELLCGRLIFETVEKNPLVVALPDEIVMRTVDKPLLGRFQNVLGEIRDELDGGRAGSTMIASDFARALFVMMLRDYFVDNPSNDSALSLLQDRVTSRVALAVLNDIGRNWGLDNMAATAAVSRATLVRAFRRLARAAPMEFLADLRLATARKRIAGTTDPIAKIAADVGYATESALSKAIMRKYGVRPGALRNWTDRS
jgi:AraC family transcriptional regulator, activator of mtrCDE